MKPILVGSKAAQHWGLLPPWRNGYTKDTDLLCSEDCAKELHEQLRGPFIKANEYKILLAQQGQGIDIDIRDNSVNRKVREWSTETTSLDFGGNRGLVEVLVAPMSVVMGCHLYTIGFNQTKFRSVLRDMEYYESLDIPRTPELLAWAEDYRTTSIAYLKKFYL